MDEKSFAGTNPLLGDRTRLMIMAALATEKGPLEFLELLDRLALTKGNLSVHLRKLEEGGLVTIEKEFVGRKPKTSCRCTAQGRDEVKHYLSTVEAMLRGMEGKTE